MFVAPPYGLEKNKDIGEETSLLFTVAPTSAGGFTSSVLTGLLNSERLYPRPSPREPLPCALGHELQSPVLFHLRQFMGNSAKAFLNAAVFM